MATKIVKVGISQVDDDVNGNEIRVLVRPWTLTVKAADTVEFVPVVIDDDAPSPITRIDPFTKKSGIPSKQVKWEVIAKSKQRKPKAKFSIKTAFRTSFPFRAKRRLTYGIKVTFIDTQGDPRTATIDPDMIIEY
jgi:hypothetical protein